MLKSSKIPVECCLTSNVLSKTVKTYDDHHFKELFVIDHPVVISVSFEELIPKEKSISQTLHSFY